MKKGLLIAGIAVLVVGGILIALQLGNKEAEAPSNTGSSSDTQTADENNTNEDDTPDGTTITYLDSGFSPSTYSARAGQAITVRNDSTRTLDFSSDEHPTHTDNTELNLGDIEPGSSETLVINSPGEWGFHNHDFDAHNGTITVE